MSQHRLAGQPGRAFDCADAAEVGMLLPTLLAQADQICGVEQNSGLATACGAAMAIPFFENRQGVQWE